MLQSQVSQSARQRLTDAVITAKALKDLSWKEIAEGSGYSREFVTAALLGQHPLPKDAAQIVGQRLDLDADQVRLLQAVPLRGSFPDGVPTDPTLYRFYEMVQVYGTTLKALVHEEFGDGIISAINFRLKVEKVEDPEGGHRAVITLDGKYLPTKPY
jgi:cyanate lyase